MSDYKEHVTDSELENIEPVQPDMVDQHQHDNTYEQTDTSSVTVLVAYDAKTGKELYTRTFDAAHAKRILSMQNSGWKLQENSKNNKKGKRHEKVKSN